MNTLLKRWASYERIELAEILTIFYIIILLPLLFGIPIKVGIIISLVLTLEIVYQISEWIKRG